MKKPIVILNDTNFSSDSHSNGRIAKSYLKGLTTSIFKHSMNYYKEYHDLTVDKYDYPLLYSERNLYSIYASAINTLSPIHLSEWGFNKNDNDKLDANRRVDFWTKYKRKEHGRSTNFFLEIKRGWYCLNSRGSGNVTKTVSDSIFSLIEQLRTLRTTSENWDDHNDVNVGLMQIHGYYSKGKESFTYKDLNDCVHKICDKRTIKNYLITTTVFPDDMEIQWESYKCRFVSIFSMII